MMKSMATTSARRDLDEDEMSAFLREVIFPAGSTSFDDEYAIVRKTDVEKNKENDHERTGKDLQSGGH